MTRLDEYKGMLTEFHRAFNHPVARTFAEAASKNFPLRVNLISEEYVEYSKAETRIDIIDGLGDLLYVVIGTVITTGITPADYNDTVPLLPQTGVIPKLLFPGNVVGLIRALEEKIPCYRKLFDTTTQVYWKVEQAAWALGIDLLKAVRLIHTSNMTKLWTKEEVRSISDTPDLFTTAPSTEGRYVVKRKSDGKVVKSPSYSPVDLGDL
jgi:predicted HAD superfamily Cof-like phosphohydrolase